MDRPRIPAFPASRTGSGQGPIVFSWPRDRSVDRLTCYVCETAEKPGVIFFARSLSDPLTKLVTACDAAVTARPKDAAVRAWMTVLGEKTIGINDLGKWAKQTGLKSMPVGVFDDPVGPPSYKLADDADLTILLFVNRKVVANFAFRKGELDAGGTNQVLQEIKRLGVKK